MEATAIQSFYTIPTDIATYFDDFQRALVLSVCQSGTTVRHARFVSQYTVKGPAFVDIRLPTGEESTLVVKLCGSSHGVVTEANILPVLSRLGLAVPKVLTGPIFDPDEPDRGPAMVMNYLSGMDLQTLSLSETGGAQLAGGLLLEGIIRLQSLTEALRQEETGKRLPQTTLQTELKNIIERGGPWMRTTVFRAAIRHLIPILADFDVPLVFSNGDLQPANFLSDGTKITGFLDFESACFEDPHYNIAKYRIYDIYPFHKTGFVERYLRSHHLSEIDFAPRMAVRCLWTLQREVAVESESDSRNQEEGHKNYRSHILDLLEQSLDRLR